MPVGTPPLYSPPQTREPGSVEPVSVTGLSEKHPLTGTVEIAVTAVGTTANQWLPAEWDDDTTDGYRSATTTTDHTWTAGTYRVLVRLGGKQIIPCGNRETEK